MNKFKYFSLKTRVVMLFDIDVQIDNLNKYIQIDKNQQQIHLDAISEYEKLFNSIYEIIIKNYTIGKEEKKLIKLFKKHGKNYQ